MTLGGVIEAVLRRADMLQDALGEARDAMLLSMPRRPRPPWPGDAPNVQDGAAWLRGYNEGLSVELEAWNNHPWHALIERIDVVLADASKKVFGPLDEPNGDGAQEEARL